jgi:nitrous oxidase accessory protein
MILIYSYNFSLSKSFKIEKSNNNIDLNGAIGQAQNGDSIFIESGEYFEKNIIIDKKISLFGHGYPIINSQFSKGDLLTITSDSVTISGIIFKNIPIAYTYDNAAIKVKSSNYVNIINVRTENSFFGIYLANSTNCKISNNIIMGNFMKETSSGNGIHLWKCNHILIENNVIQHHRDGIYFEFVKNTHINNNLSRKNMRYGLHFMFSDSCSYQNNQFSDNGAGVAVMYTKSVLMKNNIFKDNWGTASYGVLLKDIKDSKIINNQFLKNTVGIHAEGSSRLIIENNNFINNGWALKIMGNCVENKISFNNFISNSFDLSTNSTDSYNNYDNNYWSKYQGYDINKDGIGDIPYYPVSLFSVVVQNSSPALMLMHSFFINVLETAEKIFPSVIPKKVLDKKPSMRKIKC